MSSYIITDVSGNLFLPSDEYLGVTPMYPRTSSQTFRETCFYLEMRNLELLQFILVHHHWHYGKPVSILRWETCSYSNMSSYIITYVSGNLLFLPSGYMFRVTLVQSGRTLLIFGMCFHLQGGRLELLFYPEDGGKRFARKVCNVELNYTSLHARRQRRRDETVPYINSGKHD
jgi:hypothetical protein